MAEDPYVYPGTDVLRNKFGERDASRLQIFEYAATRARMVSPPTFPLTVDGYRAIHRHLFQDVFDWAGEFRTTELSKADWPFARQAYVASGLRDRFRQVTLIGGFQNMDAPTFTIEAAHHISELNAIHPFREGNGRTMRLHLEQIAEIAGHEIDLRPVQHDWFKASNHALRHNELPLAHFIGRAMDMDEQQLGRLHDALQNRHGR